MIFTPASEYSAVLDACVLVPVSLCDLLLRLAEEPTVYRPVWSEQILAEMTKALRTTLGLTSEQAMWRRDQMNVAFPEAMVSVPAELSKAVDCVPDKHDRHVLAAAIIAHADAIVTQNSKHFPRSCLEKFGLSCLTADEFLIRQYHLSPQLVLDKLDAQAMGIAQDRKYVLGALKNTVPEFVRLIEAHL